MIDAISERGLVLLGCGKMGGAMLEGWLKAGLSPSAVHILDPNPTPRLIELAERGMSLNATLPDRPALCLVAVKPQMMDAALGQVASLGGGATLVISIAAGTPIRRFEEVFGAATPIVRAMPNTPAAIGAGITAIVGNASADERHIGLAEAALAAIGKTVRLETEAQIDAVTGLSGSGPAYVFHLIETLAEAGAQQGLPPALAMTLARETVAGAGLLAVAADQTPEQLRINVTSPNGTTQAGLEVLMDPRTGLGPLIGRTVAAATKRSRELGG